MNLVEFEAKAMLRDAGLPVPVGTTLLATDIAASDRRVVLKAQIAEGGRGRRGLIVPAEAGEAENGLEVLRERMRALGIRDPRVLIEDHVETERECYFAWFIDDVAQSISLLFSAKGGIDVEAHADTLSQLNFAPTHPPCAREFVEFFS